MPSRVIEKFFSYAYHIFFKQAGAKMRAGLLKNLMDRLFILFEKIGRKFDIISSNYLKLYHEMVEKEIKMAKINSDDLVLVIGCGSLPTTTVLISMKTGANVVSVDVDKKSIRDAAQYIKNLHLGDKIKLKHANGLNYSVKNFDVIFVLYGITKQEEMLEYLASNMGKNSRIIFRTATDLQDKMHKGHIDLSKYFLVRDSTLSESFASIESYLLLKKQ